MRRAFGKAPRLSRSLAIAAERSPPPVTQVSTLPNGVRVATDSAPGHFVAAGVYIDAGSRYESSRTLGSSHLIDKLAYKSTANRTAEQMTTEMAALGQQFMSVSSRDLMFYQASTYTHSLPSVLSILSDTILNPLITSEELDAERDAAAWEISEIKNKPELILPEILHAVAFKDNTIGNACLCPEDRLETMTPEVIREYMATWYRPERTVVAAAGVPHEQLLELADRYFSGMKVSPSPVLSSLASSARSTISRPSSSKFLSTSAAAAASVVSGPPPPSESFEALAHAKARYTGGVAYLEKELDFTHIYIAFESLPITDEDVYVLAVLGQLLGGGHSFSAGGPGKGMYSRFYTHMLNQHHAIDYCQSFHHTYLDAGLFGVAMAVEPAFARDATWYLAHQLDSVTRPMRDGIGQGDLERARNQLKSAFAMSLESRMVQVEDLGRQIVAYNKKYSMDEMGRRIDAVTLSDLYRVASRVIRPSTSALLSDRSKSGMPTIVVQGNLSDAPDVLDILRRKGLAGEV